MQFVEGILFPLHSSSFISILMSLQPHLTFIISQLSEYLWWSDLVKPASGLRNTFKLLIPLSFWIAFGFKFRFHCHIGIAHNATLCRHKFLSVDICVL
jgi:hypothetical protein